MPLSLSVSLLLYLLAFLNHTCAFGYDFLTALKTGCYDELIAGLVLVDGYNLAIGDTFLVHEEHAETVLSLYCCCGRNDKYLAVGCGYDDITGAAAVQDAVVVVKHGAELYAAGIAIYYTADAFHNSRQLVINEFTNSAYREVFPALLSP